MPQMAQSSSLRRRFVSPARRPLRQEGQFGPIGCVDVDGKFWFQWFGVVNLDQASPIPTVEQPIGEHRGEGDCDSRRDDCLIRTTQERVAALTISVVWHRHRLRSVREWATVCRSVCRGDVLETGFPPLARQGADFCHWGSFSRVSAAASGSGIMVGSTAIRHAVFRGFRRLVCSQKRNQPMSTEFHQHDWDDLAEENCRQLVRLAVQEDLARQQDWTTVALVPPDARGIADVVARQSGRVAGLRAAPVLLHEMDADVTWTSVVSDGDRTERATVVGRTGRLRPRHADLRTSASQFAFSAFRDCHADCPIRCSRSSHSCANLRYSKNDTWLAASRKIRGAVRRWIQSPDWAF